MASTLPAPGLIDTDILIDGQHNAPLALAFLSSQHAVGGLQISVISAMELVASCQNKADLAWVQRFLQRVMVLQVIPTTSHRAYQLMESFRLSHGLAIPDALIAATALEHGLTLHTRNVRHFQIIPVLSINQPY